MAVTKKKSTARRKPGAKTGSARKRKSRVGSTAATIGKIKIAGATFVKSSCHTTKTSAQKQADNIRAQGNNARVIKSGKSICVYKGAKTKSNAPRLVAKRRAAAR